MVTQTTYEVSLLRSSDMVKGVVTQPHGTSRLQLRQSGGGSDTTTSLAKLGARHNALTSALSVNQGHTRASACTLRSRSGKHSRVDAQATTQINVESPAARGEYQVLQW